MTVTEEGSQHQVTVDSITSEGAGVGRLADGRVIFVHRTAPGDRALVEITRVHRRWARGRLLKLLRQGPDRRDPPCPHYELCGGCTLQHLTYPAQVKLKEKLVRDALERIGRVERLPPHSVHPSPKETRYRNRVTLTLIRSPAGKVTAGFHRVETLGSIIDVDGRCLLPEEPIPDVWDGLREHWGAEASRLPRGTRLRLTLRVVGKSGVLLLIDGGEDSGDPEALISDVPGLHSIWHRRARSLGGPKLLAGEPRPWEVWHGERVEIGPASFLQINREAAEQLFSQVVAEAGPVRGKRVIDAYCGFGALGRRLALDGATVTGIEVDRQAVQASSKHAPPSFRILEGKVEELLPQVLPADLVVLNPPRIGVEPSVTECLKKARPDRIVYVSCDAPTLSRDVRRIGDSYRVSRLQVCDLFPQTSHTETVLTLERSETTAG